MGQNCLFETLEIPRGASVEQAQAAAEEAVMKQTERGESQETLNMKLAAFAALVSIKWDKDRRWAWKLFEQVRRQKPPFNISVHDGEQRGLPQPPPRARAPPGGNREQKRAPLPTPPAPPQVGPSSGEGVPATTTTSKNARSSSSWILAIRQEDTSQEPDEEYWWQVQKGPPRKRKWGFVDEHVNSCLEEAWRAGNPETTAWIDGWEYYYDLFAMTQTSPGEAATQREIRRVILIGESDGGRRTRRRLSGPDL